MAIRRWITAITTLAIGLAIASPASAAGPRPNFQVPFPCNQTWNGNNDNSSAHVGWELDFNRGSTADLGDTVVAAAAGKVVISAHQGSTNGYGNLVKIDHGGG